MGIQAIAMPEFFTKEWYLVQKKLGKPDSLVADELHIGLTTFKKWKREVGVSEFKKVRGSMIPALHGQEYELRKLYLQGLTYDQLAHEFYVSKETIRKELRKLGIWRKQGWQNLTAK